VNDNELVTLPESGVAMFVSMFLPNATVRNNGVGSIWINGKFFQVPRDCTKGQFMILCRRILKECAS
jgi:hypothetical protein